MRGSERTVGGARSAVTDIIRRVEGAAARAEKPASNAHRCGRHSVSAGLVSRMECTVGFERTLCWPQTWFLASQFAAVQTANQSNVCVLALRRQVQAIRDSWASLREEDRAEEEAAAARPASGSSGAAAAGGAAAAATYGTRDGSAGEELSASADARRELAEATAVGRRRSEAVAQFK